MSTPRPSSSLGDELTNLGIGILIATTVLAGILRGAGSLAAWITHVSQPETDLIRLLMQRASRLLLRIADGLEPPQRPRLVPHPGVGLHPPIRKLGNTDRANPSSVHPRPRHGSPTPRTRRRPRCAGSRRACRRVARAARCGSAATPPTCVRAPGGDRRPPGPS